MSIDKVYLELTNRCNLNCVMCYRNSWDYETHDMPKELLEKCIAEIKETSSIKEVVLGGIGEPTYSGEILQVISELKDKYLTITTNGTIMHLPLLEAIVDSVDCMVVSIDGMHDVFHSIRQFPLDQIINNINTVNELKEKRKSKTPAIYIQMVLSTMNQDQMVQMIDLAVSLKASQVIFSNILPTSIDDSKLVLYKRYENRKIQKLFQIVQNYAFRKGMEVKFPAHQLKTERRCRFIEDNTLTVTSTGDVMSCYRFAHDGSEVVFGRKKEIKAESFGNIGENTFQEIWDNSSYVDFRSTVHNNHYPSCIDCDLVEGCDMARSTSADCYGVVPSCADCLWSRDIIYCV